MATEETESAQLWHNAILAEVDGIFDCPLPDVEGQFGESNRPRTFQLLSGPLRVLGREMLRPPPDAPTLNRWQEIATDILRLAHRSVREGDTGPDAPMWPNSAQYGLEWQIVYARACSAPDLEKLKAALREVAEPLLSRTHDEQIDGVVHRTTPEREPVGDPAIPKLATPSGGVKGKHIDARMLKVLAENVASHGWSAQQWADHLGCAKSTIATTKTWKGTLRGARAYQAADAATRMDQSRTHAQGRRHRKLT